MPDNKKKTGKADRARVSSSESYEVRDRAKSLGVSKEKLKAAVKKSGPMVKDVKKALSKGKSSAPKATNAKAAAAKTKTTAKSAKPKAVSKSAKSKATTAAKPEATKSSKRTTASKRKK